MKIDLKPEDKRQPVKREIELHPDLWARLDEVVKSLKDTSQNCVVGQIFDQVLPPLKDKKKPTGNRVAEPITSKVA